MILRILVLALTFTVSLSANQENIKFASSAELSANYMLCNGCNSCRQRPSAAELLQAIQVVLNSGLLVLPQVQAQLIPQLQQIITTGGIGL